MEKKRKGVAMQPPFYSILLEVVGPMTARYGHMQPPLSSAGGDYRPEKNTHSFRNVFWKVFCTLFLTLFYILLFKKYFVGNLFQKKKKYFYF